MLNSTILPHSTITLLPLFYHYNLYGYTLTMGMIIIFYHS
nr:MAG TPA: hypothetical protein [Caudoviricetes sp.]